AQQSAEYGLHPEQRSEQSRHESQRPRNEPRNPMRISKRQELGDRFAKQQRSRDQNKRREILPTRFDPVQETGEQQRRQNRREVGARHGEREQPVAIDKQLIEHPRVLVAALAFGANFQIVGRDQRDFGSGEKRLHQEAREQRDDQADDRHRCNLATSTAAPRTRSIVTSNS